MRILFRIGLLLSVLIAGIIILAVYWTFYKPLPDYEATLHLEGLEESVEVYWDPYGVPHIYANREKDLYYTIGYLHAQDRLWQMTLTQLAAEGRFAEFLGEDLVPIDRHQRTLGFWETANRIEAEAPDEIQELLSAYSDGVNEFVAQNRRNLPIEFTLTGIEPIPWSPTHSYALSRLMAWEMNVSWWSEIAYGTLYERLPDHILQELIPVYSDQFPTTMNEEQSAGFARSLLPMVETEEMIRSRFQQQGTSVGSNAWAVDGNRTESGLPILAGDPHMSLNMPGRWYEVHLNLSGKNLSGATLPGAPIVVLGQNDELAWSLTNMMSDDTDFFLEIEDPDDPDRYVADSLNGEAIYKEFEIQNEILRVKNRDDQLFQVRKTENGPVISDIYPNPDLTGDRQITMKWTGHEVSHEMWALYRINWAESLDQFRNALADFHSPGQNFIYADQSGNIAHFSAGRLPVRSHNPLLFRHGWDPSYSWQDWIPFNELPRVINPPSGFVANANNKLHTDSYPHYIATFWEPPSRIRRIENLLMEQDTLSSEWFQQMQSDDYSIHAEEITDIILPILRSSGNEYDFSQVIPYLENWNFRYDLNSTAASVFDTFFITMTRNTLSNLVGEETYQNLLRVENIPIRIMTRLLQENSFLFQEIGSAEIDSRDEIIRVSMQETIEWLAEHYGDEPYQWRWENLHTLTLRPALFAEASDAPDAPAVLKTIVNNLMSKGPYPVPGQGTTINKAQYDWNQPYRMTLGPSIRRIVDLGNLSRIETVTPTGQSGNPLSDHFGDQTELWLQGEYRFLYQDNTFFREVSYQTMRLEPAH